MYGAVAAAGADTDLVAPYSSALQAAGATAAVAPNGGGWGWYEADPAGEGSPGQGRLGTGGGREGGGGAGGGGGGFRKNDLPQALGMIASNRVVLVLFAATSVRMVATWATAGYMAVRSKVLERCLGAFIHPFRRQGLREAKC